MFRNLPGVTKNILYINIVIFLVVMLFGQQFHQLVGLPPFRALGLYYFDSPFFMPHQLVTHLFMHGGPFHILLNMFMLFMFGSLLERLWGPQRFFIYYFFTGFGALLLHQAVQAIEIHQLFGSIGFSPWNINEVCRDCCERLSLCANQASSAMPGGVVGPCSSETSSVEFIRANCPTHATYVTPTVGASGAIYGLLIAFGYLFPNTELMLLFIPVPIKAKYLIPVLVLFELYLGISGMQGGTNIAHFAHLGGALFGFLLLKYWQRKRGNFY